MRAVVFLFSILISGSYSAKILALFPSPSRSHNILVDPLLKELAKRGHEVTVLTSYPQTGKFDNYTQISVEEMAKFGLAIDFFKLGQFSTFELMKIMVEMLFRFDDEILEHPNVVKLLKSDETYDLIFSDVMLAEATTAGITHKYKAPLITLSTFMPNFWANFVVGNPAPPSYIPEATLEYQPRMTFFQRVKNYLVISLMEVFARVFYMPIHDAVMRKHFGQDYPLMDEILKNTSLVLVNHHFSMAFPRPYLPNMIEIGGFHVRPPKKLPDDIQKFLDDAKDGAIFFSLGTNAKSSNMPKERLQEFLKAFPRIKEKILWKWEIDEIEGLSDNVMCRKWFPQTDILAHPNIKLFMTHGGLLSTTEALVRGVPVVGIPIFADQPMNMRLAEVSGLGRFVEFQSLTADKLVSAVREVIDNPVYREVVQKKSALLRDDPMEALDRAVYWIEYVLRHKGAKHMRSPAQDLNWYQLNSIDVISFLIATVVAIFMVFFFTMKLLLRLVCGRRKKVTSSKKIN